MRKNSSSSPFNFFTLAFQMRHSLLTSFFVSVLRVWDVLLFEGNRVMLFRTSLAIMELYGIKCTIRKQQYMLIGFLYFNDLKFSSYNFVGPAIVTTKDAADAISLLQSLTSSTFDSSQLVLTACMGYLNVTEDRLQALREKHRPSVLAATEERLKGDRNWRDPKGIATKLYSFKHAPESISEDPKLEKGSGDASLAVTHSEKLDEFLRNLNDDSQLHSLPDLEEQVTILTLLHKKLLCKISTTAHIQDGLLGHPKFFYQVF